MIRRGDAARPSGRRFGALVHAVLASVDLDADAKAIQASAEINGRLVGATEEETNAATTAVSSAIEHLILRRAAAAAKRGAIRRETPVVFTLDNGNLVEGVVDLAFWEETPDFTGWMVVDFKTDREFEMASHQYKAQVAAYASAIQAATGLDSRGALLLI
jgi:ATP-dependent exoDNAse (exonuclease V) beta subunit